MGWFSTWAFSILLGSSVGLDHSVQADSAVTDLQKIHQEVYRGGAGDGLQQDCSRHSCVHGGQCVFMGETGQVECVCKKCHTSLKPVCGSDGRLYHNHCELHRSGCLQRTQLQPRPKTHCYKRGETCTMLEYDHLKSVLLDSAPRISQQTPESPSGLRRTLVDSLFQQMDADLDGRVSRSELLEISVAEHLERVVLQCTTQDILRYDDYNSDGHLTLQELYTAFQVTQLSLEEEKRISVTEVTVGLSAVLTCAIQGTLRPPIIWRRNGIVLNFLDLEDINDFGEDSLYISKVTTIHIGNYSCHALGHQQLVQTHVLRVKVPPVILVYPESQAQEPGISCSLFCRADGIPLPTLNWLKNGVDLQPLQSKQTSLLMNGSELLISSVRYEDTGAYTCIAKNEVGADEDISSLFVEDSARKTLANILWREEGLSVGNMFYIFSSDGIKILQPDNCEIRKHFQGSQRILGTSELLCPAHECVWSSAVSVRERLVYAAQPLHHRLLLMDTHTQTVSRVVNTEPVPVRLWYDKSHDQLWILSWGDQQKSKPSLQVITSASAGEQHPVRSLPFQGVEDFYIPPTNLIITHVRFGFIYLKSEPAVHKIDLETLRLVKTISLRNYSCVPASMAYTHLSGFYFIQCRPMNPFAAFRQLLIDGVTDAVIGPNYGVRGRPYVSPDGRFVVSVEERHGRVQVQSISFDGELKRSHRLDVKFRITDLAFQLSLLEPNQYVVAASSTQGSVLFLDLATGGSKSLESIKDPVWDAKWLWEDGSRRLVSGGVFGRYLLSHGTKSLVVLDMKESEPHCAVSALSRGGTAVWVGEV